MTLPLSRFNFAVQDNDGPVVDGATITVRRQSTGAIVQLFSDADGTVALSNPYVAADGGDPGFFATPDVYRVDAVKDGFTRTWQYQEVGAAATVAAIAALDDAKNDAIEDIETAAANLLARSSLTYSSLSALNADLVHAAHTLATVRGDGANDGDYEKVGGSGSGSWTRIGDSVGQKLIGVPPRFDVVSIKGFDDHVRPSLNVNAVRGWFGSPVRAREWRKRMNFLTASPYFLRYLNPTTPSDQFIVGTSAAVQTIFLSRRFDETAKARWGQPNVLSLSISAGSDAIKQNAIIRQQVSIADLAFAGIVPGVSTAISIEATWLTQTLVNIASANMRLWIYLYYDDGEEFENPGGNSRAVRFVDDEIAVDTGWLGHSDTDWAHTVDTLADDGYRAGYIHRNIQLPATYDGKSFKGLIVSLEPSSLTSSTAATTLEAPRLVVTSGAELDPSSSFLNWPEDYRPDTAESQERVVSLRNIDRIVVVGDSQTNGNYTLRDKTPLAKYSQLSDWNFESYSENGGTILTRLYSFIENIPALNTINLTSPEYSQPQRDFGNTLALFVLGENELAIVRGYGIEPVLMASFRRFEQSPILAMVAEQFRLQKIEIHDWVRQNASFTLDNPGSTFDRTPQPTNVLYFVSHPGTRTSSLIADAAWRQLKLLPPPARSMKIFRKRAAVSVGSVDDLLYGDEFSKGAIWREISASQITADDTHEKYYDAVSSIATQSIPSEYLGLLGMQKTGNGLTYNQVIIDDYALIEIRCETTAAYLDAVSLYARILGTDQDLDVYVRAYNVSPSTGLSDTHVAFGYTGTAPAITPGATYTVNGGTPSGTFTVVNVNDALKQIICTPGMSSFSLDKYTGAYTYGAKTLTKTGGSGPSSVSATYAVGAFDDEYYAQYGEPAGTWVACDVDGIGNYAVPASAVRYCGAPKLAFLLYKSGGFNLVTSPEMTWRGRAFDVPRKGFDLTPPAAFSGSEKLGQPLCDTSGHLASWSITGSVSALTAGGTEIWDSVTPANTAGAIEIDASNYISQSFSYTPGVINDTKARLTIDARWFPRKFLSGSMTYPDDSEITADTFDYADVLVQLTIGNFVYEKTLHASAYWGQLTADLVLPYLALGTSQTLTLTIKGVDKVVQVARVSLLA